MVNVKVILVRSRDVIKKKNLGDKITKAPSPPGEDRLLRVGL